MKCNRCEGCGKIASDEVGSPWSAWESLPPGSDVAVKMGLVRPLQCPDCGGTGEVEKAELCPKGYTLDPKVGCRYAGCIGCEEVKEGAGVCPVYAGQYADDAPIADPMTAERYEEIRRNMWEAENGSPLKDFEDVEALVFELWGEIRRMKSIARAVVDLMDEKAENGQAEKEGG